ncbi:MAG: rhomboid family intramembrane serine protease [Elusimicrobiota bacterium]
MKRGFSVLLCLVQLWALVPIPARAEFQAAQTAAAPEAVVISNIGSLNIGAAGTSLLPSAIPDAKNLSLIQPLQLPAMLQLPRSAGNRALELPEQTPKTVLSDTFPTVTVLERTPGRHEPALSQANTGKNPQKTAPAVRLKTQFSRISAALADFTSGQDKDSSPETIGSSGQSLMDRILERKAAQEDPFAAATFQNATKKHSPLSATSPQDETANRFADASIRQIEADSAANKPKPGPLATGLLRRLISKAPVTAGLILLNVLIFCVEAYAFPVGLPRATFEGHWALTPAKLLSALAQSSGLDILAAAFPLLSAMFLHTNIGHLAGNMLNLLLVGPAAEKAFGGKRALTIYLFSGFIAHVAYTLLPALFGIACWQTLGASAAIYGLYGASLRPSFQKVQEHQGDLSDWMDADVLRTVRAIFIILSAAPILFNEFPVAFMQLLGLASFDGTNHLAHCMGFLTGFILEKAFNRRSVTPAEAGGRQSLGPGSSPG